MKKAALVLLLLVWLPLPAAASPAEAGCQFELGFEALHGLIPEVVGDCKTDQRYNPSNGDSLQDTTNGLLVWRKADNFTAFTDGYRSWVNGPHGVQQRLNTERFAWETPQASNPAAPPAMPVAAACLVSAADVTFGQFKGDGDGTAVSEGTIRNPCSFPLNAVIDLFAAASRDGAVIMDGPSIFVRDLVPGESRRLTASVPNAISATWFTWKLAEVPPADPAAACPANDRCFYLDPWLASAISELRTVKDGEWLVSTAESARVRIRRGPIGPGLLGQYNGQTKTITVSTRLDSYSSWIRATVLAHELQHAAEDAAGQWPRTAEGCYRAEESAFRRQAQVWSDLWQKRLPMVGDDIHWELNEVSTTVDRDPNRFTTGLVERYKAQCGSLGGG